MVDEEKTFYPKDFEYLFVLKPNKMSTDEIINYINSCSNGSDIMFIYNSYFFMLKTIPNKPTIYGWEKQLGNTLLRDSSKRELINNLKYSSSYCDVWLSPQEKFINYLSNFLKNFWQKLFAKIKARKYDYSGNVDLVSRHAIAGWISNILDPEERVMIDIYGDETKKLSVCANVFREDLKLNNIGDGCYAFHVSPIPDDLLQCSIIKIKPQKDKTYTLPDNFMGLFREQKQEDKYNGYIDYFGDESIIGWAANMSKPEEKVIVDIYGDDEKKLSICADLFREDLKLNNIGDGFHGFNISPVPKELLQCSNIVLKIQNNGQIINK